MADYTFPHAVVLIEGTTTPAIGATGVLRASAGGEPVGVYDLNDSPISSIAVGPFGVHQAFKADIPNGVLDFGSVLLPVVSIEQQEAGLAARTSADVAAESAAAAAAAAAAAQSTLAQATGPEGIRGIVGGTHVAHGADAAVTRPDTAERVYWWGTVTPTNLDPAKGDYYRAPATGDGGSGGGAATPGVVVVGVWNGAAYVSRGGAEITDATQDPLVYYKFIGPVDPTSVGLTMEVGDEWIDPS